ncbi:hypothetical protein [Burkholderia thailandensis]|uniref:hypothetical protein n=1 Tax=Burkholderia thailandensis TaxID=57975 RepID=UPI00016A3DDB|nr:hypothetical protein [Burkholderia thailandensis]
MQEPSDERSRQTRRAPAAGHPPPVRPRALVRAYGFALAAILVIALLVHLRRLRAMRRTGARR